MILKDEKGVAVATVEQVIPMLQLAADVYKRDANVRLIPSQPFKYDSGFLMQIWCMPAGSQTMDRIVIQIPSTHLAVPAVTGC